MRPRPDAMPQNYIPIILLMILAAAFPVVTLILAKLVRPDSPYSEKLTPYECGIDPVMESRGRYSVRFYIVAILFLIFEVETVFLFPWAIRYRLLGLYGLVEMLVFLGILVIGYIWLWKKGALEWV